MPLSQFQQKAARVALPPTSDSRPARRDEVPVSHVAVPPDSACERCPRRFYSLQQAGGVCSAKALRSRWAFLYVGGQRCAPRSREIERAASPTTVATLFSRARPFKRSDGPA